MTPTHIALVAVAIAVLSFLGGVLVSFPDRRIKLIGAAIIALTITVAVWLPLLR